MMSKRAVAAVYDTQKKTVASV
ncbi:hypothetical protein MexAM1_META1p3074 [Methylorubrum extorquens AM1]|uniref:Uncharacterized protein n=1 Tax=Methylorubrum extorquens (strain ATCC 14718 / DSM 1338 / JCM 2805 / NCIMB 9133 / AM1) TaxID=272630 RepID=C5AVY6_METEA|nr:hypothetical protein MexAM1_META1p3074 [Methylorubrum extorquens AM1]